MWSGECLFTLPLLFLTSLNLKVLVIFSILLAIAIYKCLEMNFQIITVIPKEWFTNTLGTCKMFHQKKLIKVDFMYINIILSNWQKNVTAQLYSILSFQKENSSVQCRYNTLLYWQCSLNVASANALFQHHWKIRD